MKQFDLNCWNSSIFKSALFSFPHGKILHLSSLCGYRPHRAVRLLRLSVTVNVNQQQPSAHGRYHVAVRLGIEGLSCVSMRRRVERVQNDSYTLPLHSNEMLITTSSLLRFNGSHSGVKKNHIKLFGMHGARWGARYRSASDAEAVVSCTPRFVLFRSSPLHKYTRLRFRENTAITVPSFANRNSDRCYWFLIKRA